MPGGRLTQEDRRRIAVWLAEGRSQAEIGRRLSRPTSTITREIVLGSPICTSTPVSRCSNWPTAAGSRPSARGSAEATTAGLGGVLGRARCRVDRWA